MKQMRKLCKPDKPLQNGLTPNWENDIPHRNRKLRRSNSRSIAIQAVDPTRCRQLRTAAIFIDIKLHLVIAFYEFERVLHSLDRLPEGQ